MKRTVILNLPGVINARSVGDDVDPWLCRSASLDDLDADGAAQLRARGVGRVLDLRNSDERPDPRHGLPVSHVPLYDDRAGSPPRAGRLPVLYRHIVDRHGDRVAEAVGVLTRSAHPVLVHCTAGKDRTGVVVAVALSAAGVAEDRIAADYARSEREVRPARHAVAAAMVAELGLGPTARREAMDLHLASPPAVILGMLAYLRARHGGAQSYLRDHGLTDADLCTLADRLGPAEHARNGRGPVPGRPGGARWGAWPCPVGIRR